MVAGVARVLWLGKEHFADSELKGFDCTALSWELPSQNAALALLLV